MVQVYLQLSCISSTMKLFVYKPDFLGASASLMCLVHCLITPFLFVLEVGATSCCEHSPFWWHGIDYLFLVLSFVAVYQSTKRTSKHFMRVALWSFWGLFFVLMLNHDLEWYIIPKQTLYVVAVVLAILHRYNLNYCQCKTDSCCAK